jgi:dihydrofolate reductase
MEESVGQVICDISMSLDGFVAGPNPRPDAPLGDGGERLHDWTVVTRAFRRAHGMEGGEDNEDSAITEEWLSSYGAVVMGRSMFSGGKGSWEADTNADGWWGDEPPFHAPVFVLTHHPRETVVKQGGTTFTFVTDGIESAIAQAREAAGDKDVAIGGGGSVIGQAVAAGLLDELNVHLAPMLLGDGTPLFGDYSGPLVELETTQVIQSPAVTHLRYRVKR